MTKYRTIGCPKCAKPPIQLQSHDSSYSAFLCITCSQYFIVYGQPEAWSEVPKKTPSLNGQMCPLCYGDSKASPAIDCLTYLCLDEACLGLLALHGCSV